MMDDEQLATRLTRVWVPPQYLESILYRWVETGDGWTGPSQDFVFTARMARDVVFDLSGSGGWTGRSPWSLSFNLALDCECSPTLNRRMPLFNNGWYEMELLRCRPDQWHITSTQFFPRSQKVIGLCAQWLPLFRRNCWLSGANIEATAHEKAQWIQGFNREEVELWNLKV